MEADASIAGKFRFRESEVCFFREHFLREVFETVFPTVFSQKKTAGKEAEKKTIKQR